MRLLAIRAAFELPHDHKAFAFFTSAFEIIGKVEKTLQEPGLFIEPVIRQYRPFGMRTLRRRGRKRCGANQHSSTCNHVRNP